MLAPGTELGRARGLGTMATGSTCDQLLRCAQLCLKSSCLLPRMLEAAAGGWKREEFLLMLAIVVVSLGHTVAPRFRAALDNNSPARAGPEPQLRASSLRNGVRSINPSPANHRHIPSHNHGSVLLHPRPP